MNKIRGQKKMQVTQLLWVTIGDSKYVDLYTNSGDSTNCDGAKICMLLVQLQVFFTFGISREDTSNHRSYSLRVVLVL